MPNVKLNWALPTTRVSGQPLGIGDINLVHISLSADAINWTAFNSYTPDVLEAVITDLEFGDWHFKGVVEDIAGNLSEPLTASITLVNILDPPSPLASLTATLA